MLVVDVNIMSSLFGSNWAIVSIGIVLVSVLAGYIIAKCIDKKVNMLVWIACSTFVALGLIIIAVYMVKTNFINRIVNGYDY